MKFNLKSVYTFETLAPAILGSKIELVRYMGMIDYDLAITYEPNLANRYREIYPVLPHGTPDTPKILSYHCFETRTKSRLYFCEQWIKEDSIAEVAALDISITIANKTPADVQRIAELMKGAGYPTAVITAKAY